MVVSHMVRVMLFARLLDLDSYPIDRHDGLPEVEY